MPNTVRSSLSRMAAISFSLAAVITAPVVLMSENGKASALTSALAAGDKVVKTADKSLYEIRCTGLGRANAFKIEIDRQGNKVVTDEALLAPKWPVSYLYGNFAPAGRCTT
jgi:hypothetical protein